jgi:hypothetical protein
VQDLKYLTVDDLERLLANLKEENARLAQGKSGGMGVHRVSLKDRIADNQQWIDQIEIEIFERTMLGAKTDGGVST